MSEHDRCLDCGAALSICEHALKRLMEPSLSFAAGVQEDLQARLAASELERGRAVEAMKRVMDEIGDACVMSSPQLKRGSVLRAWNIIEGYFEAASSAPATHLWQAVQETIKRADTMVAHCGPDPKWCEEFCENFGHHSLIEVVAPLKAALAARRAGASEDGGGEGEPE